MFEFIMAVVVIFIAVCCGVFVAWVVMHRPVEQLLEERNDLAKENSTLNNVLFSYFKCKVSYGYWSHVGSTMQWTTQDAYFLTYEQAAEEIDKWLTDSDNNIVRIYINNNKKWEEVASPNEFRKLW